MKCTYCGAEVQENCLFCMSCGTRVDLSVQEPLVEEPVVEEIAVEEPVVQEPVIQEPEIQEPVPQLADKYQERRVVIDPEKFEFRPKKSDAPLPRAVSSWELVPADTLVPKLVMPTKRGLGRMIFLGLITLGIYPTVIFSKIVTELNILASRYDGKRTVTFFGMLMLAPLTLGIYSFVWFHKLCGRIGDELQRRGVEYKFGPAHFWLWNILGSFILVGPFVFLHKLMKSMNLLNKDFNVKG